MTNYHSSDRWRVLLVALPLLMGSLTGYSNPTDYTFHIRGVSQNNVDLLDGQGSPVFTYSIEGNISNLSYYNSKEGAADNGSQGLQFYISGSNSSFSMTTMYDNPSIKQPSTHIISNKQPSGFSGILKSIFVQGFKNEISNLVIEAYDGTTNLGKLLYNQKIGYFISGLSYILQSKQITLKFSASNAANGVSVEGLTDVTVTIDESVYPLTPDKPVTFDYLDLYNKDLSNYPYKGILFTLNSDYTDEGFDYEETGVGSIYIVTTMTDAKVDQVNNAVKSYSFRPGEPGYAADFAGGITLLVAKGAGKIVLNAETESNYAFHVKVGNHPPVEVSSNTPSDLEVPYIVNKDTYVYIYMVNKGASARGEVEYQRPPLTIGRRGTAHGRVYQVKCTSTPVVFGDANDNGILDKNDAQAIADYIMGKNPTSFNVWLADINEDGVVNAADLVEVIQIFLELTP